MTRAIGAFTAFFLLFCATLVRADDLSQPILLVATPVLQGPYTQTAVLVVPMGNKHIGLILNRATDTRLAAVFPEHAPSAKVIEPIYFGGPEASDAIFALTPRNPGQASLHLFGDLYLTGNGKIIDQIIEQTPNEARYFVGFVGWMPDELEAEIAKGFWDVGEASAADVFRKDTGTMWEELSKRLGKGKAPRKPGEKEAAIPVSRPQL